MSSEDLQNIINNLFKNEEYFEIIHTLTDDVLEEHNNSDLYAYKARANYRIEKYDECEKYIQKSIKIDPKNSISNSYLGHVYNEKGLKEKAIEHYEIAIKSDYTNVNAINGLGNIYLAKKNFEKAKEYFEKAVEIDKDYPNSYNGIGIVYYNLKDYELSLNFYNKAIKIDKEFSSSYYNKALVYQKTNQKKEALTCFEKYVVLKKGINDFFVKHAKSRVLELKKLIKNEEYSDISDLIEKIKKMLCTDDDCLTHYTSLSVSNELILKESGFRISEGSFLNDTSEGKELFNFLNIETNYNKLNQNLAKVFSKKPFIGSFVSKGKYDDLTLWRMYGKEQKEEAGGCAITIDLKSFLNKINEEFLFDDLNEETNQFEELKFYKVIYKQSSKDIFILPNSTKAEQRELNDLLIDLKKKVVKFKARKRRNNSDLLNLINLLNSLAYLFKSDEYQYENEVRLVLNGNGFEKIIDDCFTPPKVYIELVSVKSSIRRITLGPKVNRTDEWAAALSYCFEKNDLNPEILISNLPFK